MVFAYDYASGRVGALCDDIPQCLTALRKTLAAAHYEPNQCIVNDYHVDAVGYGPVIGCFTLGSGAVMTFRYIDLVEDVHGSRAVVGYRSPSGA